MNYLHHHIHNRTKEYEADVDFLLTSFHGMPCTNVRMESWELMAKINQHGTLFWCVIKDFKEIATQDEKIKCRLRSQRQKDTF